MLRMLPALSQSPADARIQSVTSWTAATTHPVMTNGVVLNPNPDMIAEFKILTNNYTAEYGRNAGGVVSVVTKSGTNRLHGSLFEYLRNDDFNANDYFSNGAGLPRPILKRNQFGGTFGGPIVKDKLFYYFGYQGQRQHSVVVNPGVGVFTPAELTGQLLACRKWRPGSGIGRVSAGEPLLSAQSAIGEPGHHRSLQHQSGVSSCNRRWLRSDFTERCADSTGHGNRQSGRIYWQA